MGSGKAMRPDWPKYWFKIAEMTSTRATCPRKHVGVVIVNAKNRIASTGYNGAESGADHCDDVGCILDDNHCIRVVHAEINAIRELSLAARLLMGDGYTMYSTLEPCDKCKAEIEKKFQYMKIVWLENNENK